MYWEKEVCVYLKLRLYCLWCARWAQSFFIGSCIIVDLRVSVLGPCFASTANKETSVLTRSLNECTVLNTLKASRQQWLLLVRRKALKALKASRFGSFFLVPHSVRWCTVSWSLPSGAPSGGSIPSLVVSPAATTGWWWRQCGSSVPAIVGRKAKQFHLLAIFVIFWNLTTEPQKTHWVKELSLSKSPIYIYGDFLGF